MLSTEPDLISFVPADYFYPSAQDLLGKAQNKDFHEEIAHIWRDKFLDRWGLYGNGTVYKTVDKATGFLSIIYSKLFSRYFAYKGIVKLISKKQAAAKDIKIVTFNTVDVKTSKVLKFLSTYFGINFSMVNVDARWHLDVDNFLKHFKDDYKYIFVYIDFIHPVLGVFPQLEIFSKLAKMSNVMTILGVEGVFYMDLVSKKLSADYILAELITREKLYSNSLILAIEENKRLKMFSQELENIDFYWLNLFAKKINKDSQESGDLQAECRAYKDLLNFILEQENIAVFGSNVDMEGIKQIVFTVNGVTPTEVYEFFKSNGILIGKESKRYRLLYKELRIPGVNSIAVSHKISCKHYEELLDVFKDFMFKYGLV